MERKTIVELIGKPAVCEQLAEECAELGKVALKMARILRRDNPTPVTMEEVNAQIIEEFTDVIHCAFVLGLDPNFDQIEKKDKRWRKRISEGQKHE